MIEPSKEAIEAALNSKFFYVKQRSLDSIEGTMDWSEGLIEAIQAAYAIDFAQQSALELDRDKWKHLHRQVERERDQLRLALQEAQNVANNAELEAHETSLALQESQQRYQCYEKLLKTVGEYQVRELNLLSDLRESQQEVERLKAVKLLERHVKTKKEANQIVADWGELIRGAEKQLADQQAVIQELAEALRESLKLGTLTLMSEERSSSHSHGPKRADMYAEKARALEDRIRAALASASPWLRKEGEG